MLTGELAPDEGKITLGVNLQMAALDQGRETLDPNASVRDTLTGGRGDSVFVGGQTRHVVSYMKDFLFGPSRPALRSRRCRAASADGSPWRARSPNRRTCWCSTSRPTISISRRSICSKR
jgi:ATP-binding cassette subfamily F protein uup